MSHDNFSYENEELRQNQNEQVKQNNFVTPKSETPTLSFSLGDILKKKNNKKQK